MDSRHWLLPKKYWYIVAFVKSISFGFSTYNYSVLAYQPITHKLFVNFFQSPMNNSIKAQRRRIWTKQRSLGHPIFGPHNHYLLTASFLVTKKYDSISLIKLDSFLKVSLKGNGTYSAQRASHWCINLVKIAIFLVPFSIWNKILLT